MARFETPISDREVASALHGLDLQSVMMARSFEQSSRLNAFIDQYVEPDSLEYETEDGTQHKYEYRRISAIGDEGSLLHLRLHRQTPGQPVDSSLMHIAVISHIDDPQPATMLRASCTDLVRFDSSRESRFTIGQPNEVGLQVVDAPMNELQWGVEKILAHELALASLPFVSITTNGWEYRRSDRHWEKLHDMHMVRERVAAALSRGMGHAAVPDIQLESASSPGQFVQKVVV